MLHRLGYVTSPQVKIILDQLADNTNQRRYSSYSGSTLQPLPSQSEINSIFSLPPVYDSRNSHRSNFLAAQKKESSRGLSITDLNGNHVEGSPFDSQSEAARIQGMNRSTLRNRIKLGFYDGLNYRLRRPSAETKDSSGFSKKMAQTVLDADRIQVGTYPSILNASKLLSIDRRMITKYAKSGDLYVNKKKGISYYFIQS